MSLSLSTTPASSSPSLSRRILVWGVAVGALQAASPLVLGWLEPTTVHAIGLAVIAAIYIGFAVADGRPKVIAVEVAVASLFVVVAALAVPGPAWLLVLGLAGHGAKDLWQHRTGFVTGTRWWPPFCFVVDFTVAPVLVVLILAGVLGR